MEGSKQGMTAAQAVESAVLKWEQAPMHIKLAAGAYITPIFGALRALAEEVEQIKGGSHGK